MAYFYDPGRILLDKKTREQIRSNPDYLHSKKTSPCKGLSTKQCNENPACYKHKKGCRRVPGITGMAHIAKQVGKPSVDISNNIQKQPILIPGLDDLQRSIRVLVNTHWDNHRLEKVASYGKTRQETDLFFYEDLVYDKGFLRIEKGGNNGQFPSFGDNLDINNIMTDLNVYEQFNNQNSRARVIHMVLVVMRTMFQEIYVREPSLNPDNLNLMFKGGITMRFLIQDAIRDFNSEVEDYLYDMVSEITKISDFDFEIMTSPTVPDKILYKINIIVFMVLARVRNFMADNAEEFFDILKLNKTQQHKLIRKYGTLTQKAIDEMKPDNFFSGSQLHGIDYDLFCKDGKPVKIGTGNFNHTEYEYMTETQSNCRADFAMITDRELAVKRKAEMDLLIMSAGQLLQRYGITDDQFNDGRDQGNKLYVTHNPGVIVKINDDEDMGFQLNRIKYSYVLYLKLRDGRKVKFDAPGEIIDISSALSFDRKKGKYATPFSRNKYFRRFDFVNNDIAYISYSYTGHISDINSIIFSETGFKPWLDFKYGKRIERLIFMYVFRYFSKYEPSFLEKLNIFIAMIEQLKAGYRGKIKDYDTGDKPGIQDLYDDIRKVVNTNLSATETHQFLDTCLKTLTGLQRGFMSHYTAMTNQVLTTGSISASSLDRRYPVY